jgi:hypothetical protein
MRFPPRSSRGVSLANGSLPLGLESTPRADALRNNMDAAESRTLAMPRDTLLPKLIPGQIRIGSKLPAELLNGE